MGYAHKKRINSTLTIAAAFTSASLSFLKALLKELSSRGIQGGSIYVHPVRGYARLQFAINDALKLYEIMYTSPGKLFLKRKKDVFKRFIKTRSRSSTG